MSVDMRENNGAKERLQNLSSRKMKFEMNLENRLTVGKYSRSFNKNVEKGSDKFSKYLEIYDVLFHDQSADKVIEIGIQNGGSLEIWAEIFPMATSIIGIDINEQCAKLKFQDPRIQIIIGDASHKGVTNSLRDREYSLIVDDGSHESIDVINTFVNLFSKLAPGGTYVIEDMHTAFWPEKGGGLQNPQNSLSFFFDLTKLMNFEHWPTTNTRQQALQMFVEKYSLKPIIEDFSEIDRVDFYNSLCIVHKRKNYSISGLGERVVSGTKVSVEPAILSLGNTTITPPAIHEPNGNVFFDSKFYELENEVNHLRQVNLDLLNSLSWRLTSPLRRLGKIKALIKSSRNRGR